jgi:cytoskeletal protein CcmA (bactofilin family)
MFNRDAKKVDKAEPQQGATTAPQFSGTASPRPVTTPAVHSEPARVDLSNKSAAKPAAAPEKAGSKLVVGADIKLRGLEITDCDTLYVEGQVEASLDTRVIQIAENGVFSGAASMDVAEIWGQFEGELTARQKLVIHATGRVSGTVRYGSLRIEEGGHISGDVDVISRSSATPHGEKAGKVFKVTSYDQLAPETKQPVGNAAAST